jgi:RNA polymerase sigma-70 factor (ECF subfamily)
MSTVDPIELVRRAQAGDAAAAAELVRRYEPHIRLEVRLRLRDRRLRRVFDSVDICQSVLLSFFLRVATGQCDVDRPQDLLRLLIGMARNKLAMAVRHHRRRRRDHRRLVEADARALRAVVCPTTGPSQLVAGEELLREFRSRLSEEERQVADLRAGGHEWATVAAELGGTPEGRRKQLARAVNRVLHELQLDRPGPEA